MAVSVMSRHVLLSYHQGYCAERTKRFLCGTTLIRSVSAPPIRSAEVRVTEEMSLIARLRRSRRTGGGIAALELWRSSVQLQPDCKGSHPTMLDEECCTLVLSIMAREGTGAEASALLRLMRDVAVHPNHAAIGSALAAWAASRAWEEAVRLLSEVESWPNGPGSVAYNIVIGACGHASSADAALKLLRRMHDQNVRRTVMTYGAAIGACGKGHDWEFALHLLGEMRLEALRYQGPEVDAVAHSATVNACARAAAWRAALSLVKPSVALEFGLPTLLGGSFVAAITACDRAGAWIQAVGILDSMRAGKIPAGTVSFNAVISACGRCSVWEAALAAWNEMGDDVASDVVTNALVLRACERGGQWDVALRLLREMWSRSAELGTNAYNAGISACALGRRWLEAMTLLRRMSAASIPMTRSTRNAILRSYDSPDQLPDAMIALQLLRGSLGASQWPLWGQQGLPAHLELNELSLDQAATQLELRLKGIVNDTATDDLVGRKPIFDETHHNVLTRLAEFLPREALALLRGDDPSGKDIETIRHSVESMLSSALGRDDAARVMLVGSRLYGVALYGADVDLVVELSIAAQRGVFESNSPLLREHDLARLSSVQALLALRRHMDSDTAVNVYQVLEMALDAKRPILRLTKKFSQPPMVVEVSFDQSLVALQKSELLARCFQADRHALNLARLLRVWAELRCVTGQRQGYVSGYALSLMVVFYCQRRLQTLGPLVPEDNKKIPLLGRDCGVADSFAAEQEHWASKASEANYESISLLESGLILFPDLVSFYAYDFDWDREVVSVRSGRLTLRERSSFGGTSQQSLHALYIADPVEAGVDLGGPYLGARGSVRLHAEFRRACRLLKDKSIPSSSWASAFRKRGFSSVISRKYEHLSLMNTL